MAEQAVYNLKGIGKVEIGPDYVNCDFNISSDEFFNRFNTYAGDLGRRERRGVQKSIDDHSMEKIRDTESVRKMFKKIEDSLGASASTSSSGTTSERKELAPVSEDDIVAVPIEVRETLTAKFMYDFLSADEEGEDSEEEEPEEEAEGYGIETKSGVLTIKNIDEEQAIWDVVGHIQAEVPIENLDETLEIKRLGPGEEQTYEYELTEGQKPQLDVKEFISTINDPEKKTYSLNIDQENQVLFKILLKNPEEYSIKNIIIEKTLIEGSTSVSVDSATVGDHSTDDGKLKWEIEELGASDEAEIEFHMGIQVNDKNETVRSGEIVISYDLTETQSGLTVDEFSAFGNNNVMISDEQMDDNPDIYRSSFFFENLSPYTAKILSLELTEPNAEGALVELPEEELYVQSGEMWESEAWEIDTKGELPQYTKNVQFTLLPTITSITSMNISVEDIELAVAMFEAGVKYDVGTIASHREVPFTATHTMVNGGAAPFDYLSIEQSIQSKFIPPKKEEMVFKKNGEVIEIDQDLITIEPDTYDSEGEHRIFIELDDLRESDIGMFNPEDELTLEFPIIADRLSEDEQFITNAKWTANTYPRGEPIVIIEEGEAEDAVIQVVHQRIKLLRGKAVRATGDPEVFEVVLKVHNNSNYEIDNYEVRDRIPEGFEVFEPSLEITETEKLDGREVLVWNIEKMETDEKVEIKYMMRSQSEDAKASEAQFSM